MSPNAFHIPWQRRVKSLKRVRLQRNGHVFVSRCGNLAYRAVNITSGGSV